MSLERFEVSLSRHAFSPADVARAGDVWRLLQDVAVDGSTRRGWSPQRYQQEGRGWVVRKMVVVHPRPLVFGEELRAETWVHSFRRKIFNAREIAVFSGAGLAVRSSTTWVHIAAPKMAVAPAPDELIASFELLERPELPAASLPTVVEELPLEERTFRFRCWHTWLDPLGHANHPLYVDWCEEALAVHLVERGIDPHGVVPVAEQVTFRGGVVAEAIEIRWHLAGKTADGAVVAKFVLVAAEERVAAEVTLVRRF